MRDYLEELLLGLLLPREEEGEDGAEPVRPAVLSAGGTWDGTLPPAGDGSDWTPRDPDSQTGAPSLGPAHREQGTKGEHPAAPAGSGTESAAGQTQPDGTGSDMEPEPGPDLLQAGETDLDPGRAWLRAAQERKIPPGQPEAWTGEEKQAAWKRDQTDQSAAQPTGQPAAGAVSLALEWKNWDRAARTAAALPWARSGTWGNFEAPVEQLPWHGRAPAGREGRETPGQDARAVDRAFQRDARRYDGAFPLY